ncbi:D-isomer specific 2-hydroxyacid dehydrogenase, NAD-binding [Lecanosticta acicola]|uniref:D-isomer specific 2-hydroxyacid dehydrogenase, NAD-binding n=1 Tax=Lecanosticta acicola TaxID=111012 RepID=A0AAI8Z280_9PEZI|nr:D-isomer specific 2-hydroxyacid dehydrogenase, NAD-binding [Lecanosticta acicola]
MSGRPDVLVIASSVQEIDELRRQRLEQEFNLIQYDCSSVEEFKERMKPGGPYSSIQAIIRLGWLKAGQFATHLPFATDVVPHYPPSLKIICCTGHGHDAADTEAITQRGIWYCNTPNACTEAVANTATYLILDTFRYLTYAQWCARYDWMKSRELGTRAVDPLGKVLGIVGLGDIGLQIAKKCESAYGMEISYHGPRRKAYAEGKLMHGARYFASLEEMIPEVDCLCLAAPYTRETHHLLSAEQFRLAKASGLRVVNIARGKMIDEDALLGAMERGQVVGVGLDVHADEPGINEKFRENWMTTVLPHIGVCSRTSWENFERQSWDNLEAFFEKGRPVNFVKDLES